MAQYAQPDSDCIRRRVASRVAWATGALFLLVMAAGADRPPPPGFALVVLLAGGLVWGVRRLLPRLLAAWQTEGARPALLRAALLGFAAGAAAWAIATAISLADSAAIPVAARLVGFAAVSIPAALAALLVTAIGWRLTKRAQRRAAPGSSRP